MDDGENLLVEVDLSQCTEPESFLRYACDVNKIPHSVIVLYKLEKAQISIFSNILSILEVGVAEDDEGSETKSVLGIPWLFLFQMPERR